MHNILKLYYKYLLSKEVCIILSFIISLFIGGIIYSSGIIDGFKSMNLYLESNQLFFLTEYLMITKLVSLVLAVLLVIVLYTETSQNLRVFVIDSFSNKYLFYLLKAIFSIIVTIILTLIVVSVFVIIYKSFTPYVYSNDLFYRLLLYLFIQNIFYVFLTHLLISLLPNIIIGFLPIVLFWYMEINFITLSESQSILTQSILQIIPNITLESTQIMLYNDVLIYVIFIVIFILSYIAVNLRKDIV